MNPFFKKGLHWAGGGVGLAGVIFIAIRLHQCSAQLDFQRFGAASWAGIFVLAFVYGCANFFLAAAWWNILGFLRAEVSKIWAVRTYGISQLAKYVPGNIFQFASRQALGLAADLPGWVLAKSVFWELALISVAGVLFTCLAIPLVLHELSIIFALLIFLSTIFAVGFCIRRFLGSSAIKAFAAYLLFLTVSGLVFVGTLVVVTGQSSIKVELVILYGASYVVAWLAGLMTPGAPAGVGVREVVLLFLLGAEVAEADLLLAVVLNRVITIAGDGGFFAWASLKSWKLHANKLP